jgi:hypothetical protein
MSYIVSHLPCASADNPTAIVKPYDGPDPGYILAESDGGLSNRLRVLAAYMWVGYANHAGAHLVFIWDVNEPCPGHFLEIFEPIDTVIFATNHSRYVLDKAAKIVYENSLAVFTWTLQMNNIPKAKYGFPTWGQIEYEMYKRFVPTRRVMDKVTEYVRRHNICEASAMHLRVTDLAVHMARKKQAVNINSYFQFVESRPADEPIYLLTDNPESQNLFLQKYGPEKILVYSVIKNETAPLVLGKDMQKAKDVDATAIAHGPALQHGKKGHVVGVASASASGDESVGHAQGSQPTQPQLAQDHRFTTLEHTLIDILIASHSKHFKPAMYSSLSDLVKILGNIGKRERGWCS